MRTELRINLNQNFVLHVVGAKLDLANGQREVDLDRARRQVRAWLCEPPGPTPNVLLTSHNTLSPQSTMNTTLEAAAAAAEEPKARQSMSFGFGSFGQRSRREDSVRTLTPTTTKEPGMPFSVSEVSALTNTGIDQLFFQVSMKLSERREAIERDAERKARESIMLTTASTSSATRNEAPAGTWGCC